MTPSISKCVDGSCCLLPAYFCRGCVITLDDLGNVRVDEIYIGGLKDLQALCKCRDDPTGAVLLGFGIPPAESEQGSPHSQEWLFSQPGLSEDDLNNKNIVVFTVNLNTLRCRT